MVLDNPEEVPLAFKPLSPYGAEYNTPFLQQKDYYTSWVEWAAQKFEQVIKASVSSGDLYEVPTGYIFYLTSCFVSIAHTSAGKMQIEGKNNVIISVFCSTGGESSSSLNFTTPLKFNSGDKISCLEIGTGIAGITGFLVPFQQ